MTLPDSVPKLQQFLAAHNLVSNGDFSAAVSSSARHDDVDTILDHLAIASVASRPDSNNSEPLLTTFQVSMIRSGRGHDLCRGSWILRESIGVGGMGEVFAARHLTTKRIDALKFLTSQEVSAAERFRREISALAELRHSGLPVLYTSDNWNGVPFFAMEYVRGRGLDEIIDAGPADISVATDWFRQLAVIVKFLHQRGFLHRDLKPGNIRIAEDDGRVVLLDLGLCLKERTPRITVMGLGSPHIMSPESWDDCHEVTPVSDLYSLGCTFFSVLTGSMPFDGTIPQLCQKHLTAPPPRVRDLRPECPEYLDELVDLLLSKNPANRIQTAQELTTRLQPGTTTVVYQPGEGKSNGQSTSYASVTMSDRSSFDMERTLIRFGREIWTNVVWLRRAKPDLTENSEEFFVRGLEAGLNTWREAMSQRGTPLATRLLALGDLLKEVDAALETAWHSDIAGAIIDSLTRHYTNILVFLGDWLTEDVLADAPEVHSELSKLRGEIEDRFALWADALNGKEAHGTVLDEELCKSLQGPYHRALPLVLDQFDRRLAQRFQDAIRNQLNSVPRLDDGRLLRDFLLDEAIPYWGAQLPTFNHNGIELAAFVGSCLTDLLQMIEETTPRVLDCIPKASKTLRLDSLSGDRIRNNWSDVTNRRLFSEIARLRSLAQESEEFRRPLYEAMDVLRPAVEGNRREGIRVSLCDDSAQLPVRCRLLVRHDEDRSIDAQLIDVRYDLLGIRLSVDAAGMPLDENYENSIAFLFPSGDSTVTGRTAITDCVIEFNLHDGATFRLHEVECVWWTLHSQSSTLVGARVLNTEGDLDGFVQHLEAIYGVALRPAEKFFYIP